MLYISEADVARDGLRRSGTPFQNTGLSAPAAMWCAGTIMI